MSKSRLDLGRGCLGLCPRKFQAPSLKNDQVMTILNQNSDTSLISYLILLHWNIVPNQLIWPTKHI